MNQARYILVLVLITTSAWAQEAYDLKVNDLVTKEKLMSDFIWKDSYRGGGDDFKRQYLVTISCKPSSVKLWIVERMARAGYPSTYIVAKYVKAKAKYKILAVFGDEDYPNYEPIDTIQIGKFTFLRVMNWGGRTHYTDIYSITSDWKLVSLDIGAQTITAKNGTLTLIDGGFTEEPNENGGTSKKYNSWSQMMKMTGGFVWNKETKTFIPRFKFEELPKQ
jgi:hypothetical protein